MHFWQKIKALIILVLCNQFKQETLQSPLKKLKNTLKINFYKNLKKKLPRTLKV